MEAAIANSVGKPAAPLEWSLWVSSEGARTKSLLLEGLMQTDKPLIVWIEKLYIDQENNKEKHVQVQLINEIFLNQGRRGRGWLLLTLGIRAKETIK